MACTCRNHCRCKTKDKQTATTEKKSDSQYSGGTDGGEMFLQGSKSGGHVVWGWVMGWLFVSTSGTSGNMSSRRKRPPCVSVLESEDAYVMREN